MKNDSTAARPGLRACCTINTPPLAAGAFIDDAHALQNLASSLLAAPHRVQNIGLSRRKLTQIDQLSEVKSPLRAMARERLPRKKTLCVLRAVRGRGQSTVEGSARDRPKGRGQAGAEGAGCRSSRRTIESSSHRPSS